MELIKKIPILGCFFADTFVFIVNQCERICQCDRTDRGTKYLFFNLIR